MNPSDPFTFAFEGGDTVDIQPGDLEPGVFPEIPESLLPEGWDNLSHTHTHMNMTTIVECFWDGNQYALRIHLLINGAEVRSERALYPISQNANDADIARSLFEEASRAPVDIEDKITALFEKKYPSSSTEVTQQTRSLRGLLKRLFSFGKRTS